MQCYHSSFTDWAKGKRWRRRTWVQGLHCYLVPWAPCGSRGGVAGLQGPVWPPWVRGRSPGPRHEFLVPFGNNCTHNRRKLPVARAIIPKSHSNPCYYLYKLHAYHSPRAIRNCTLTKQLRCPLTNYVKLHPSSTSTIANCSWLLCVHNPDAALLDSRLSVTTPCFHPNAFCFITERHQY